MNICFLARPSFDKYSVAMYKNMLQKHNVDIGGFFITSNEKESKFICNALDNVTVCETSKYLREHWDSFTKEKLIEFEEKYECAPIWKYIYADRFLIYRDYDYVVQITAGLFSFFEDLFSNNRIDFYYSEVIATLQCYIAYIVGKKLGTRFISQMTARGSLDSIYHYFTCDEFAHDINLSNDYLTITYSDQEIERANSYLCEFEEKHSAPGNMLYVQTKPRISLKNLALPLYRLYKSFDKDLNDPCSYMYFEEYKTYTNRLKFYFNYRKAQKYYKKANYNTKYIYFPLHYQPEACTIVCAEKYEKQLFFIDSWAKSLPADTVLYVKEHYAFLGNRDPHFYEELKQYPNVVIVDPWESSRKLIENAVAVTTLTGTAGWEAMLLRKPVFLGGETYFDKAPGIIKVSDIFDNYLKELKNWKRPDRKDVVNYLCACFRSLRKGNVYAQNESELIEDNIDAICDSLYKQLIFLKNN